MSASPVTDLLLVALGAAAGAPLRFLLGRQLDGRLPWGVMVANVAGSAVLGGCAALALSGSLAALVGTGFCGALTTYSTFAVGVHDAGPTRGAAYAVLTICLSLAACFAGFAAAGVASGG